MKKLLLLILISLLLPMVVSAKSVLINGIYYNFIGDEAEVTSKKEFKSSYSGAVVIPESVFYKEKKYRVTSIGKYAFYLCKGLTSVTIPDGVTSIGNLAFDGCEGLTSIIIPYSVTSIGNGAFSDCSGLTSIIIPNSVTSIDKCAFSGCSGLTSLKVETGNATYDSRNDCNAIIETATNTLIVGCQNTVIPNSVIRIGKHAFSPCSSWSLFSSNVRQKSVSIPNGVVSIGECAFYGYDGLTSVTIPESVTSIGDLAFSDCGSLTSVTILGNVLNIGGGIFSDCDNLRTVTISSAIKDVKKFEFSSNVDIVVVNSSDLASSAPANTSEASTPNSMTSPVPTTTPQPATAPIADVDKNLPTTSMKQEHTFALIIANEHYELAEPVEFALNDGKIFADYCEQTLGLPKQNIRLYEDATYGKMRAAIRDIKDIAVAYDGDMQLIVYYAGHGVPDEQSREAYLLPVDVDGRHTEEDCYPLSKLYKEMGSIKSKNVTIFLDACFSGAQRGEGMLASARGVAIKPKDDAPQGNMVVFSAATGDETAFPYKEKGHGMFTYFLLKKLRDSRGDCTLGELSEYIQTNVRQQSVVVNRKSQTPTVLPSQSLVNSWQTMKLK